MSENRTIRIGLLGFGVVGQGVWKNIEVNRSTLKKRLGVDLTITDVVVKNLERERAIQVPPEMLSSDPARVVDNSEVDIVCELMGGTTEALHFYTPRIRAG